MSLIPSVAFAQARPIGSGVANQHRGSPQAAPQVSPQVSPQAQLSPLQNLHRQAYYQAIQAGYNPQQSRAYADQVVQQRQQAAGHPSHMAGPPSHMAGPPSHMAAHAPPRHQFPAQPNEAERLRVAQQHQASAANQNAQLWQSLQQRRPVQPPPGMAMARSTNSPGANPAVPSTVAQNRSVPSQAYNDPARYRTDDSEERGVKAASAQLARLHSNSARINTAPEPIAEPHQLRPTPTAASNNPIGITNGHDAPDTVSLVPARVSPPRTSTNTRAGEPRSVLEVPVELSGPSLPESQPQPLPTRPTSGTEGTPVSPMRTPRKLPDVDPQPLQNKQRELEIELEGFSDQVPLGSLTPQDFHEDSEAFPADNTRHIQPVTFQQPVGTQSYAGQQYAPQMGRSNGTSVLEPPAELVELFPAGREPVVGGFQVEPVPFSNTTNRDWQSQGTQEQGTQQESTQQQSAQQAVPPPTGVRATPISGPVRTRNSPRTFQDGPGELALPGSTENLPSPRNLERIDRLAESQADSLLKSCEQLRRDLLGGSLRDISLDLSTPISRFSGEATHALRVWRDANGGVLANGRALSATSSGVRILDDAGIERELAMSQLSGQDQKYVWDVMDLPFECGYDSQMLATRCFSPTLVSWHASNLCHKPLYFEDIRLERYGHTVGPIRQPVLSAVRFLGQAALLPYQMSLHPPNECQYPLGLFRPGNCAPYLRTPFPWERRALGYQAGVATGLFLLVP